ncbi:MAG: outer membrane protein assembly factor BamD [Acidobacteriota bacterium]|nr:outer membrane protein assembly factor BamD [Acidobacteriota bacterium]
MVVDLTRDRLRASLASAHAPRFASARTPWRRAMLVVLLLLGAGLFTSACTSASRRPPVGTLEPDKFLWERGTAELTDKHWFNAREYFRQLTDSYPQSQYRADAKLGLADSYLGENSSESKVLAINEYREFLSFYPTHARADYAQYKLGMAHFYQMSGPERDQTETREAITELNTMVQRYPNSALTTEALKHLRDARDRLSDAEYRVAYFYVKTQKFPPAAIDRFTALLKEDPQYSRRDAVYYYLADALIKMNRQAEALPYLDRLVNEFEQSEYLEQARTLAATLKADQATK